MLFRKQQHEVLRLDQELTLAAGRPAFLSHGVHPLVGCERAMRETRSWRKSKKTFERTDADGRDAS